MTSFTDCKQWTKQWCFNVRLLLQAVNSARKKNTIFWSNLWPLTPLTVRQTFSWKINRNSMAEFGSDDVTWQDRCAWRKLCTNWSDESCEVVCEYQLGRCVSVGLPCRGTAVWRPPSPWPGSGCSGWAGLGRSGSNSASDDTGYRPGDPPGTAG